MVEGLDQQLISALAHRRVTVTNRQARRWREDGQLPEPISTSRGREGFVFTYPDEVIEHATCLAGLLRAHRNVDVATVVLFLKGFAPRERALRAAYNRLYTDMLTELGQQPGSPAAPAAEAWAKRRARRSSSDARLSEMRDRLRPSGLTRQFATVLANIASLVLGAKDATLSEDSLTAVGFDPRSPFVSAETINKVARRLTVRRVRTTAANAPIEDLTRARETIDRIDTFVQAAADASRISGLYPVFVAAAKWLSDDRLRALAIPAIATIPHRGLEPTLAQWEEQLPRFRALFSLAESLPEEWHPYLAPDGMTRLVLQNAQTRNQILDTVSRWAKANPAEAEALRQPAP